MGEGDGLDANTKRVRGAIESTARLTARIAYRDTASESESKVSDNPRLGVADLASQCACLLEPGNTDATAFADSVMRRRRRLGLRSEEPTGSPDREIVYTSDEVYLHDHDEWHPWPGKYFGPSASDPTWHPLWLFTEPDKLSEFQDAGAEMVGERQTNRFEGFCERYWRLHNPTRMPVIVWIDDHDRVRRARWEHREASTPEEIEALSKAVPRWLRLVLRHSQEWEHLDVAQWREIELWDFGIAIAPLTWPNTT
jgi:hypothetical protein